MSTGTKERGINFNMDFNSMNAGKQTQELRSDIQEDNSRADTRLRETQGL